MNVLIYAGASEPVSAKYPGIADESFARRLERVCLSYLSGAGVIPAAAVDVEISLTFMSADEIAALNGKYRETEGPTDVLSFPMWEAEDGAFQPPEDWEVLPLGDIVVCPEVVEKNAVDNGKTFEEEKALVIFHGVLHLTGCDHDTEERKADMWSRQDAMVLAFKSEENGK